MSMEVVLGVDPGISNTGWAVVDGSGAVMRSGVVRTYARWEMADRITHIFDTISTVVDTVQPGLAVVEGFSFRGGGKSAMAQFVKSAVVVPRSRNCSIMHTMSSFVPYSKQFSAVKHLSRMNIRLLGVCIKHVKSSIDHLWLNSTSSG